MHNKDVSILPNLIQYPIPKMYIPIAANVLGTIGAVCWSIQLIPQIIINYRRHSTTGLQPSMMILWALAGVPLGVYNISGNFNIALRIQPQILTVLSLITWGQCGYYDSGWSLGKCLLITGALATLFGGVETALMFALREATGRHVQWPVTFMGVLSTVLLSAGVLRHYWDIYVHRTVRGISFIFVAIDAAGDIFSLVSIFFQAELDVLGIVIYATEFFLWCGVFACGGYFNLLPYIRRKLKERRQTQASHDTPNQHEDTDDGVDVALQRIGSSTSVFRTSGSIVNEVGAMRERVIEGRHEIYSSM